jgi:hypothetical protein
VVVLAIDVVVVGMDVVVVDGAVVVDGWVVVVLTIDVVVVDIAQSGSGLGQSSSQIPSPYLPCIAHLSQPATHRIKKGNSTCSIIFFMCGLLFKMLFRSVCLYLFFMCTYCKI